MNNKLKQIIEESSNILVLTGAGVSTDSGLVDFRSDDGLYSKLLKGLKPQFYLSYQGWDKYPEIGRKIIDSFDSPDLKPSIAHEFIFELYKKNKLLKLITQNLDLLHEKSGIPSDEIIHIHGTVGYKCKKCGATTTLDDNYMSKNFNFKTKCCNIGIARPKALLYGETYKTKDIKEIKELIKKADLILILGTTLEIPALYNLFINTNMTPKIYLNKNTGNLKEQEQINDSLFLIEGLFKNELKED